MSWWFASGHAVDLILVVVAVEMIWLVTRQRADLIWMLLPAIAILLGLRAALVGAPWWQVAIWLSASLPAHLYDMRRRLDRRRM